MKFLCHNIVVLIQSVYELGIEPAFWQDCPKSQPPASEVPLIMGF